MILPPEYNWLESYLCDDSLWLEDSLNWEEAFDLVLNDFILYSFFTTSSFFNVHFFTDYFTKISILDIIFLTETDKLNYSKELYDLIIWDLATNIHNKFLPLQFFFYSDYQDFLTIMLYYSPELLFVLNDYINIYWTNNVINYNSSIVFDLFSDLLNTSISEFVEYFILFFSFIWIMLLFSNIFRIIKWNNTVEVYFIRFLNYFYSIAKDTRLQFEMMLHTFFFFIFYWTMSMATFDDDQEELLEAFDVGCFYFFCILIIYFFYKHSTHYFAFIEGSVTEGKSVLYILKQFFRDFINTFALFLRFFILLFRLNVYDTLDDFYDSYYIYFGDFDEDEYLTELFFSFQSFWFYQFSLQDDELYSLEGENEIFLNCFYIYYLFWAKFFTFIFFILEEILRLSLAFYICYLITFEVHAVNYSYSEDSYFYKTRLKKNFLILIKKTKINFF